MKFEFDFYTEEDHIHFGREIMTKEEAEEYADRYKLEFALIRKI